jgi:hypothetical protein
MQKSLHKFLEHLGFLRRMVEQKRIMRSLQHQRFLLRSGMKATAHVVEVETQGHRINNLIEIKLALGIHKPDGNVILTETHSIVEFHKIPIPGQKLQIWFTPQDISCVLIQ